MEIKSKFSYELYTRELRYYLRRESEGNPLSDAEKERKEEIQTALRAWELNPVKDESEES